MRNKLHVLILFLLVASSMLAACGGGDDKEPEKKKEKWETINLPQSIKADTGISLQIPEGWSGIATSGDIRIGNTEEVLNLLVFGGFSDPAPDQFGMMVIDIGLVKDKAAEMGLAENASLKEVAQTMTQSMIAGEGASIAGDISTLKLGGHPAASATVQDANAQTIGMYIYVDIDGMLIVAGGVGAPGELDKFKDSALAIAASIKYEPA